LRNVTATAPYGHNGAYSTLEGIIRHHLDPIESLDSYDATQLVMPQDEYLKKTDFVIQQDKREMKRLRRYRDIDLPALTDKEIELLIAFMGALTDEQSLYGRLGAPSEVPSKIEVD
jgi:cytochrome c peroxidase